MPMRFHCGQIVITNGAMELLREDDVTRVLRRHLTGDWGELDAHDRRVNHEALRNGNRLMSVYTLESGVKIWVITEADRSVTTILLPEEY